MSLSSSFPDGPVPVPPITITTSSWQPSNVTTVPDSKLLTPVSSLQEKKKRTRRAPKPKQLKQAKQAKQTALLTELGDALVDQLYIPSLNDRLEATNVLVNHLRTSLSTAPISDGSSITSSSRTLTTVESHVQNSPLRNPSISYGGDTAGASLSLSSTAVACPEQNTESINANQNRKEGDVFSLDDFSTMTAIQRLTEQYGRVAHMGILDHSYRFFVNKARTAALSFKVQNRVVIVGGDPLCDPDPIAIRELLDEFAEYRKRHHWGIAFMGASESFVRDYVEAQPAKWTSIRFGTERVLNPQTNEVLLERSGKRIAVQNRQLLNPQKGGVTLGLYVPAMHGTDTQLQSELVAIYDAWRAERNHSTGPQAFITVYDPFALPNLMTFVHSRGSDGQINGFAALRRLGCNGYHIDPCIAAPGSPKGITDLLIVAAMALLNRADISYLGFGFEPSRTLLPDDVRGMRSPIANITRDLYGHTFTRLPIHGKKAYHDKFRPDAAQDSPLYLVFPDGMPGPRHLLAMMHMANISLRKMLWTDLRSLLRERKSKNSKSPAPSEDSTAAVDEKEGPTSVVTVLKFGSSL
ncbi:hypothetical protein N7466_003148 [Penicillium verhagenii]|uniref:uncharacterized protein n=1 Tax=Penicillium verhagenii TaxID=1562060 RepID=UPI002544F999|nr:uncharacterized protein N7466_003148 [Penicillium verhagenii]KAJ5936698.1 hypothetical protein N7466_003148 [Penicillium verhagenii]